MATAQLAGSRNAGPIVGAYAVHLSIGKDGYQQRAKSILEAADELRKRITEDVNDLKVIGCNKLMVVAF